MHVSIRADASIHIGSGHVMRCMTLAQALASKGARVSFICREFPGHLCDYLESSGFQTIRLPYAEAPMASMTSSIFGEQDASETIQAIGGVNSDWLIVDHYSLEKAWESKMRPLVGKIMVIDDLANRCHDCNLLLDQNLFTDAERRYTPLVPSDCVKLLGPNFALLRPEFAVARSKLRERDGSVKRILIFFGGYDPTGETIKVLQSIKKFASSIMIDVIIGTHNAQKDEIKRYAQTLPHTRYFHFVKNMTDLIVQADLFIGTAGISTWERCCLGLPSVVITNADNQVEPIVSLAKEEVLLYAGHAAQLTRNQLEKLLDEAIVDTVMLKRYSINSMQLVDGKGAKRCADHIGLQI